jgi:hypothetical protein
MTRLQTEIKRRLEQLSNVLSTVQQQRPPWTQQARNALFEITLQNIKRLLGVELGLREDRLTNEEKTLITKLLLESINPQSLIGQGILVCLNQPRDQSDTRLLGVLNDTGPNRLPKGYRLKGGHDSDQHFNFSGLRPAILRFFNSNILGTDVTHGGLAPDSASIEIFQKMLGPKMLVEVIRDPDAIHNPYNSDVWEVLTAEFNDTELALLRRELVERFKSDLEAGRFPTRRPGDPMRAPGAPALGSNFYTDFHEMMRDLDESICHGELSAELCKRMVTLIQDRDAPFDRVPPDLKGALLHGLHHVAKQALTLPRGRQDVRGGKQEERVKSVLSTASPELLLGIADTLSGAVTDRGAPERYRVDAATQRETQLIIQTISRLLEGRASKVHSAGISRIVHAEDEESGHSLVHNGLIHNADLQSAIGEQRQLVRAVTDTGSRGQCRYFMDEVTTFSKQVDSALRQLDRDQSPETLDKINDLSQQLVRLARHIPNPGSLPSESDNSIISGFIESMGIALENLHAPLVQIASLSSPVREFPLAELPEGLDVTFYNADGLEHTQLLRAEDRPVPGENARESAMRIVAASMEKCAQFASPVRGHSNIFTEFIAVLHRDRHYHRDGEAHLKLDHLEGLNAQIRHSLDQLHSQLQSNAHLEDISFKADEVLQLCRDQIGILDQVRTTLGIVPAPGGLFLRMTTVYEQLQRQMGSIMAASARQLSPHRGRSELAHAARAQLLRADLSGHESGSDATDSARYNNRIDEWTTQMDRQGVIPARSLRRVASQLKQPDLLRTLVNRCCIYDPHLGANVLRPRAIVQVGPRAGQLVTTRVRGVSVPHVGFIKAIMGSLVHNGIQLADFGISADFDDDLGQIETLDEIALSMPQCRGIRELAFAVSRAFKGVSHGGASRAPRQLAAAVVMRERPFGAKRVVNGTLDKEEWARYGGATFSRNLVQNANNFTAAALAMRRKLAADRDAGHGEAHSHQIIIDFVGTYGPTDAQRASLQFSREQRAALQPISDMLEQLNGYIDDGRVVDIARAGAHAPGVPVHFPPGFASKLTNLRRVLASAPLPDERSSDEPVRLSKSQETLVSKFGRKVRSHLVRRHSAAARHLLSWWTAVKQQPNYGDMIERRFGEGNAERLDALFTRYYQLTQTVTSKSLASGKRKEAMRDLARTRARIESILPLDIFNDEAISELNDHLGVPRSRHDLFIGGRPDSREEQYLEDLEERVSGHFHRFIGPFERRPQFLSDVIRLKTLLHKRNRLLEENDRMDSERPRGAEFSATQRRLMAQIQTINRSLDELARSLAFPDTDERTIDYVLGGHHRSVKESYTSFKEMVSQVKAMLKKESLSRKERVYLQGKLAVMTEVFLGGIMQNLQQEGFPSGYLSAHVKEIQREVNGAIKACTQGQVKGSGAFLRKLVGIEDATRTPDGGFPAQNNGLARLFFGPIAGSLDTVIQSKLNSYVSTITKVLNGRHSPVELKLDILRENQDTLIFFWDSLDAQTEAQLQRAIGKTLRAAGSDYLHNDDPTLRSEDVDPVARFFRRKFTDAERRRAERERESLDDLFFGREE